ncbi:MAG: TPM domain-containing protein [Alphaproteobacteria bacterium]|nr:TPM domain-containing protein [Alphaproteobacteria bacterium]
MHILHKIFGFFCALLVALPLWAQNFPSLTGYVVDAAGVLTQEERYDLTQRLQAIQPQQVVVASVPSLEGYDIDQYANMLFRHWELGDKERNDGVLILLAPNERFMRIEVGYGLEYILTDAHASYIVRKMTPFAKANHFGDALKLAANDVADILNGASDTSTQTVNLSKTKTILVLFIFLPFFIVFFFIGIPLILEKFAENNRTRLRRDSKLNRRLFFIHCSHEFFSPVLLGWLLVYDGSIPLLSKASLSILLFLAVIFFPSIIPYIRLYMHFPKFPYTTYLQMKNKDKRLMRYGRAAGFFSHSGGFGGGFGGGGGSSGGGGASGGF